MIDLKKRIFSTTTTVLFLLLQVDVMHCSIIFHDSLYNGNKEFGMNALSIIATQINQLQEKKGIGITMFNLSIDEDAPKQHNGHDCGVVCT